MKSGTATIHIVSPASVRPEHLPLSREERDRAASFRFENDASHWAQNRAALRAILGNSLGVSPSDVPIRTSALGKPHLAEPFGHLHFNLSHCEDLALVALSPDGPLGIDLEPSSRAPSLLECRDTFCHPEEIAEIRSQDPAEHARSLLQLWTAKEALLKALGTGFSHPPEHIRILSARDASGIQYARSDSPLPGVDEWQIRPLVHAALTRHVAMIAIPHSVRQLDFVHHPASTSAV
jgi:4'-phosphopantetheinyl transferase